MLKFITKGNSHPQGKPRVYFCCHPQEYSTFLGPISEMLLSKQNCSLWYLEDPNAERNADFWADLRQMQLLIMPVTTRLLTTDNPAMEEFRFAVENHIPVLPLMQESGLDVLFNKVCGDLQFLDPNLEDPTAINYDEKLQKYLSEVLIGDELAEKVRAAFDAYLFLSYRKKDRRHAHELMRLIHQNDFCRDTAIWYDEYLTPGENFNNAIQAALQKCDLFALAVTPSLLEKVPDQDGVLQENYVAAHEYPMAKESGKPILPIQMLPTDQDALAEKYQNLPFCVDGHDAAALSSSLSDALQELPLRKNNNDILHNYLIGLAYLNGIDVEVDYDSAVTLITAAAENGLVEAVTQLAHMYRVGFGVERNYETAMHWKAKEAAILEEQYRSDPTEENFELLFWSQITCGGSYEELGKIDMAQACYESAQRYTEARQEPQHYFLSVIYQKFAAIHEKKGDWKTARHFLDQSLTLQTALCKEGAASWRSLALTYEQLGDLSQKNGDYDRALQWFDLGLKVFEALANESGSDEAFQDVGVICNRIGDLHRIIDDLAAARDFCQRSLDIREKLAQTNKNDLMIQANLATCYEKMGDIYRDEADQQTAKAYYEKSIPIRLALVEETGLSLYRRDLMVSYLRLGGLDSIDEAKDYGLQALAIAQALASETEAVQSYMDLVNALDQLGTCWEDEDPSVARDYYAQSLDVHKILSEKINMPIIQRSLANHLVTMGQICNKLGEIDAAMDYYKQAVEIGEALAVEAPSNELFEDLIQSNLLLGNLLEEEDDLDAAICHYERSMTLGITLVNETGSVEVRRLTAVACLVLGKAYAATGSIEQAKKMMSCSAGIAIEVAQETGAASDQHIISDGYLALAELMQEINETEEALRYYQSCLELRTALAQNSEDTDAYRQLAEVFQKLAALYIGCEDVAAAEAFYRRSLEITGALAEETGDLEDWETAAMDYSNVAYACKEQGRTEESITLYQQCLQIRKAIAQKEKTVDAFDHLGRTLLKLALVDQECADTYLQEAAQIYYLLTQADPENPQFHHFLNMLQEYL